MAGDDLKRPNHYAHDSLGDPATCDGDHNHPGLEERALAAAAKVPCARCGVKLMEDVSLVGMMVVRLETPATGDRRATQLCGRCALLLREFLSPGLAGNAEYRESAGALREAWRL